jgi:hypothetical protein
VHVDPHSGQPRSGDVLCLRVHEASHAVLRRRAEERLAREAAPAVEVRDDLLGRGEAEPVESRDVLHEAFLARRRRGIPKHAERRHAGDPLHAHDAIARAPGATVQADARAPGGHSVRARPEVDG